MAKATKSAPKNVVNGNKVATKKAATRKKNNPVIDAAMAKSNQVYASFCDQIIMATPVKIVDNEDFPRHSTYPAYAKIDNTNLAQFQPISDGIAFIEGNNIVAFLSKSDFEKNRFPVHEKYTIRRCEFSSGLCLLLQ